ncbi:hypothetical protein GF407_00110 [candidate division KSB1 bacterium]|nr:hypothetical protein [candidate division KSB1 bacterium]
MDKKILCDYLKLPDSQVILIPNPDYIYAPYELCPMAAKITTPREQIKAIVQDMDGTTTSTENLCLYSLEQMVRHITARPTARQWSGLDVQRDYPHIIGNSTTKHVEYLIRTHEADIHTQSFKAAYLRSAILTLLYGKDEGRKIQVENNLLHFHCADILQHPAFTLLRDQNSDAGETEKHPDFIKLLQSYTGRIDLQRFNDRVRAAIDVYYQIYHEILNYIDREAYDRIKAMKGVSPDRLIEPMPGIAIYLAMIKGFLGEDLSLFYDELSNHLPVQSRGGYSKAALEQHRRYLPLIGRYFQQSPVRVAVVTSSIAYEADIVLKQVFRQIRKRIADWPLCENTRSNLVEAFSSYERFFDAVITASDSSELRLKPHRDLYSLSLFRLGIEKAEFDRVIGFEDSESGTISIRAAGIGLCVAVPFAETSGHKLDHASFLLHGGMPEAILIKHMFLSDRALGLEERKD